MLLEIRHRWFANIKRLRRMLWWNPSSWGRCRMHTVYNRRFKRVSLRFVFCVKQFSMSSMTCFPVPQRSCLYVWHVFCYLYQKIIIFYFFAPLRGFDYICSKLVRSSNLWLKRIGSHLIMGFMWCIWKTKHPRPLLLTLFLMSGRRMRILSILDSRIFLSI